MNFTDTQRYLDSVKELDNALKLGKKYLPLELQKQGNSVLTAAKQRLNLGVEHTIVALAGGTGSGKSSTFNALAGLEFADVGALRPTTVRTAACTWDSDATALLNWVGVDADRRISRDTALDGVEQAALKGLILLDLPDHDSVETKHRDIVDKVLPLVDVLIWVVDPQKYADQALHADYLRKMVDARASMIVVLNQIDTVAPSQRDVLLWDVAKLLAEDGLESVKVRPTSARTGQGIDALRDELRVAVAGKTMASQRLNDELLKLARLLDQQVPGGVVTDLSASLRSEADRYLVAAGVPALADEVAERTRLDQANGEPPSVQIPSETALASLRSRWLDRVTAGMHPGWEQAVRKDAGSVAAVSDSLTSGLNSVRIPWGAVRGASKAPMFGLAALSVVALVVTLLALVGVIATVPFALLGLGVAVLAGVGVWLAARRRNRNLLKESIARAEEVREECAQVVMKTIEHVLFAPISQTLGAHDTISKTADHVIALNVREAQPTHGDRSLQGAASR